MSYFSTFLLWILSTCAFAVESNICGSVDFRSINNEMLKSLIYMNDLAKGNPVVDRVQCGLPGELRICSACEDSISASSHQAIRNLVGTPEHINWHAKWHNIRRLASQLTSEQFTKLVDLNRIPKGQSKNEFVQTHGVGGTQAGEDFLYMHRMMIKMVQVQLASESMPCVKPWSVLPLTMEDPLWPVPSIMENSRNREDEQQRFHKMKAVLKKLEEPAYLRTISLNDYGSRIESSLHQSLHDFYRSTIECTQDEIENRTCDDLVPVNTSPLNKYFWKIHGLVDQLIGKWLEANQYKEIALDCQN